MENILSLLQSGHYEEIEIVVDSGPDGDHIVRLIRLCLRQQKISIPVKIVRLRK